MSTVTTLSGSTVRSIPRPSTVKSWRVPVRLPTVSFSVSPLVTVIAPASKRGRPFVSTKEIRRETVDDPHAASATSNVRRATGPIDRNARDALTVSMAGRLRPRGEVRAAGRPGNPARNGAHELPHARQHRDPSQPPLPGGDDVRNVGQLRPRRVRPHRPRRAGRGCELR